MTGTLPKNWTMTTLGEIADTTKRRVRPQDHPDKPYIGMEHIEAHTMRLLGTVPAKEMRSTAESFSAGDVLYGRLRPYLNKVYCPDFDGLCSTEFIPFRKNNVVESKFLQYFLNSSEFMRFAAHLNEGDRPRVDYDQLKDYPMPLPPKEDQKKIVAKIDELFSQLDAATAVLKRVQANLKRYKASVLKAACEGRLVPTEAELARREGRSYESGAELLERILKERRRRWEEEQRQKGKDPARMKYPEPAKPDTDGLPKLPEGWVWASLDQIGYLGRGKSKHRPRNSPDLFGGPYPFIQTGEIRHAEGHITSFTNTYSEKGLQQSKLWPRGTLCITIAANIAETAILSFKACFPDSVVGFIPEFPLDVRFIEFFFRTAKQNLERYAPATAQKNINLEILNNLAIPIPPIEEQRRIITEIEEKLSVVAHIDRIVNINRKRNTLLHQSILEQAFTGMLCSENGAVRDGKKPK